jgi:hypothetical protein
MLTWLRRHKFETHLFSFTLMILASIGLYATLNADLAGWIWVFLSGFIVANLAAMLVK